MLEFCHSAEPPASTRPARILGRNVKIKLHDAPAQFGGGNFVRVALNQTAQVF